MEVEVVFLCGDSVLVNLLWNLPAREINTSPTFKGTFEWMMFRLNPVCWDMCPRRVEL